MAAAANAASKCADGEYDSAIDIAGFNQECSDLPTSLPSPPSEPPSRDDGRVTLVMSNTGAQEIAVPGVIDTRVNLYFVMINASDGDIRLSRTSGEYLYPQDTNFPRVPLSFLAEDVVIAANTERGFTLVMADPDNEISASTFRGDFVQGVLYYSMPAAADACGERGFADDTSDATRNNCNPFRDCDADQTLNRETNRCEGGGDPGNGGGNNNTPPVGDNQRTSTPPQRGDHDYVPAIAGGVGILLLAGWQILTDGGVDNFSFSPDFGYAITESGYSYKYGGRVDFRKDAWSLYWTAGQRNADGDWGDFRYESGGEYDGGFWRAAFAESVRGETTDYDFSLSADYAGGIWKISPEFFADARYKNGEFAMTNSFRISGKVRYDDWNLSAVGDAERVRLSAVREF